MTDRSPRRLHVAALWLGVALLSGAAGASSSARGQAPGVDAEHVARFARTIDSLRDRLRIPGLSAAIVADGRVVWSAGMGFADVEERQPATSDTPYEVASLSKTFASVLLMQLVETGKIGLDDPMSRYSSDYGSDSVTVRHVFTHTSEGVPGTRYQYNGNLFDNLGDVVNKATGSRYRVVLSRTIIEPLGLQQTSPGNDLADDQAPMRALLGDAPLTRYAAAVRALAKPYRLVGGRVVRSEESQFGIGTANGVVSTVLDLAKFDSAIDAHLFIRTETQALAWTPYVSARGDTMPYGLGWFVQRAHGERIVWHNGYLPDLYSALYLKLPDRKLTLILLANSDALSSPFHLAQGDVQRSAFACAFLRIFAGRPGAAGGWECESSTEAAIGRWLTR